ncbi:MAG: endolytic transglycosylase MltG [Oscillospiraceae bacterium]|nr:endolytic transglycosylase MltG [Oscillospiraceae bacterium]
MEKEDNGRRTRADEATGAPDNGTDTSAEELSGMISGMLNKKKAARRAAQMQTDAAEKPAEDTAATAEDSAATAEDTSATADDTAAVMPEEDDVRVYQPAGTGTAATAEDTSAAEEKLPFEDLSADDILYTKKDIGLKKEIPYDVPLEEQYAQEEMPAPAEESTESAQDAQDIPADETEGYIPEDEPGYEYSEDDVADIYKVRPQHHRGKKRRKSSDTGRLIFGLILTMFIIAVSVGIAVFVIHAAKELTGVERSEMQIVVDIPEGSTTADIAHILYQNGIITDEKMFLMFSRSNNADSSYIAGSHVLSPNMTYDAIIEILQENEETVEREEVNVTFVEGCTIIDAAKELEEAGVCDADRFIYIFNSSTFGFDFEEKVETSAKKFMKMEGFLFPDTYTFYKDEEPEVVAKKIYRNFENKITPNFYGRMKDLGYSLEQTITLASIVQAESRDPDDMKKIASVFYNRLESRRFDKLESDPTRKYVENVIKPNIEVSNEEMYKNYNTYEGTGLPPGAICNPGLDAITAVLYPAETDYYFFCANVDTGETFFAETNKEHEKNLIRAGIKEGVIEEDEEEKSEDESEEAADDSESEE